MTVLRAARALLFVALFGLALAAWAGVRARLPDDGATTLSADALGTAVLLALLAAAGASLAAQPPAARLGLRPGRLGAGATALAALGLLGLSHALEGGLALAGTPSSPGLVRFAETLAAATAAELALALVVFALGSAAAEELLFRGLLQRGLERRLGGAAAITITAALFGAAHGDAVHALAAFPLGAYLGVLARLDGSIRPALAAHALNNAVAVLEAGLGIHVPGGAGALASIGVGLAIAGAGLGAALRRTGPAPAPALAPPADGA